MTSHTWERPPFSVSTDPARLDLGVIHGFLRGSYWAKGISREVMARSIEHSLCFGAYRERAQVGFARIISDLTTFAYLSDLFVLEPWRGHGLSKFMMECITRAIHSCRACGAGCSRLPTRTAFTSSTDSR